MMYIRSQNYTNMVVAEHEIQRFEVPVVVLLLKLLLSLNVFVPTSAHALFSWTSDLSKYTYMSDSPW